MTDSPFSSFLTDTHSLLNHPANPRLQGMIDNAVSSGIQASQRIISSVEPIHRNQWAIPPGETYSARYSSGIDIYYQFYDEAIRNSTANALAMRRDAVIIEPLDHRKMATVSQDWYLKPDDPDDPDQQRICDILESVLENASMFQQFLLNLLEDIYFGKAGCQCQFGYEMIKGKKRLTITDHAPVMGDKIQYSYTDEVPGILIRGGSYLRDKPEYAKHIRRATLGPALFLGEPWLRDQFTISKFRTADFDYIWEGDKALAVHGIGMRDSLYWAWNIRTEVWSWILDAIQRVSANGMTIGLFEYGNATAETQMMQVMRQLVKDNYAVVGVDKGTDPQNIIRNIPVSAVGYEIMINIVKYLDDFIRRTFLGQELTSTARATGIGAGAANVQKSAFDHIVGFDSNRIAESVSKQILKVLIRYNTWPYRKQELQGDQLPFGIRFLFEDRDDEDEKPAETAKTVHEMGIGLSKEDVLDKVGFSAPQDTKDLLPGKSQEEPVPAMPGGNPREKGIVPPNGQTQHRPTFPTAAMNGTTKKPSRIDQMEMFAGPVDEARDETGKWTSGGPSHATKTQEGTKYQTRAAVNVEGGEGRLAGSTRSLFGRNISSQSIALLAGSPDDASVEITASQFAIKTVWHNSYGNAVRHIYKDGNTLVMENESFRIDKNHQGKGIGAELFNNQIGTASRLGVKVIKTEAVRDDKNGWFGYKVWPMMGYDGDIPEKLASSTPNGEKRLSELMRSPEGRDWWSKNGDSVDLEFDLTPGSYSMKTWEAYKARKGIK